MIKFRGWLTEMATFSPKNFPSGPGKNREFTGAGERTTYAPETLNGYKFKEGFPMEKPAAMYSDEGKILRQLKKGERVHFTIPATLHRSTEFGITRRTTLAPVSLKGFDQRPDGYVAISAIVKPGGGAQGRVGAGSKTQDMVAVEVKDIAFKKGIEVETEFKTAKPGSTIPDLVMTIAKKSTQFEIKGTNNRSAPITFFDKSVKRAGRKIDIIQDIADVYIRDLKIGEGGVGALMKREKYPSTFVGLIDFFQSRDSSIGLAGDAGVIKSGKLPKEFAITDGVALAHFRQVILDHFKDGKDDYFVIHNRANDSFEIYFVGGGKSGNVLKSQELPNFKSFVLATYGGASGGATRVGLKIKL
jgi:hypothetical protein